MELTIDTDFSGTLGNRKRWRLIGKKGHRPDDSGLPGSGGLAPRPWERWSILRWLGDRSGLLVWTKPELVLFQELSHPVLECGKLERELAGILAADRLALSQAAGNMLQQQVAIGDLRTEHLEHSRLLGETWCRNYRNYRSCPHAVVPNSCNSCNSWVGETVPFRINGIGIGLRAASIGVLVLALQVAKCYEQLKWRL